MLVNWRKVHSLFHDYIMHSCLNASVDCGSIFDTEFERFGVPCPAFIYCYLLIEM